MPWLLMLGCSSGLDHHPTSVAEHEREARHYEAAADSIEQVCWKARRSELTVDDSSACWKAEDVRFLQASRDSAMKHRAAAAQLRAMGTERKASTAASR